MIGIALLGAGCSSSTARSQKTPDYREASYRTISPGDDEPPEGFRREPLDGELRTEAWEFMRGLLVNKRWEFTDVRGTDLVVYWGFGRAPSDRTDRIDENSLVIDVFERETGERVWFGYVSDARPLKEGELEEAISQLMLGFPRLPPRPVAY